LAAPKVAAVLKIVSPLAANQQLLVRVTPTCTRTSGNAPTASHRAAMTDAERSRAAVLPPIQAAALRLIPVAAPQQIQAAALRPTRPALHQSIQVAVLRLIPAALPPATPPVLLPQPAVKPVVKAAANATAKTPAKLLS